MRDCNGLVAECRADGARQKSDSAGRLRRRVDRFRKAGMIEHSPGEISIEQAVTADELVEAYALVHDTFVFQNYIMPQPGGLRIRVYEALPEMATFVAKCGGRIVGVLSIVPDSDDLGLPSDKAFKTELDALRMQGRRVAEITNLALLPEFRNSPIFLQLAQIMNAHVQAMGYDDLFVSISPGHAMFFETILRFDHCGDRRSYSDALEDIVEGKRLDMRNFEQNLNEADQALADDAFLYNWFFTNNPHFDYARSAAQIAQQKFLDPTLLRRLFVEQSDLLSTGDPDIQCALRRRWGDLLFDCVSGMELRSLALAA